MFRIALTALAAVAILLGGLGCSDKSAEEEEDEGVVAGVTNRAKSTVDQANELSKMQDRELIEE